jgi:hypothetical protein
MDRFLFRICFWLTFGTAAIIAAGILWYRSGPNTDSRVWTPFGTAVLTFVWIIGVFKCIGRDGVALFRENLAIARGMVFIMGCLVGLVVAVVKRLATGAW